MSPRTMMWCLVLAGLTSAGCGPKHAGVRQVRAVPPKTAEDRERRPRRVAEAQPRICELDGIRALSSDGALLALARGKHLVLYETASWKERARVPLGGNLVALDFSPTGKHLVLSDVPETTGEASVDEVRPSLRMAVYETQALALVKEVRHGSYHPPPSFFPDGQSIAFALDDGETQRVEVWALDPPKKTLERRSNPDAGLSWVVAGRAGHVAMVFGSTLEVVRVGSSLPVFTAELDLDTAPVFSADGRKLAFRRGEGLELWSEVGNRVRSLRDPSCTGNAFVFSPDGKAIAVGGFQFNVCLFDTTSGRLKGTLPKPRVRTQPVEDEGLREPLQWNADGSVLVVSSFNGFLLYDVKRGKRVSVGNDQWSSGDARVFLRARDRSIVVAESGLVRARIEPGARVVDVSAAEGVATQHEPSPDGELFARYTTQLELVPTDTSKESIALEGTQKTGEIDVLLFDPRSRFVLTQFDALRIWDARTGKLAGLRPALDCTPPKHEPPPAAEPEAPAEEAEPEEVPPLGP